MQYNTLSKYCKKCDEIKPHTLFNKNKCKKDGLQSCCKSCMRTVQKASYNKHRKKRNISSLAYSKTDKGRKYRRSWAKKRYHSDPEYRKKCIKNVVEHERKKLATDPTYKLLHYMRGRLRKAVKGYGDKHDTTLKLVGCDSNKLREYIESKFTEGMAWENYGEWHVDHIRPCCSFDLSQEEDQRQCFHYTNLQPLWAKDNFQKGGKFDIN